MLHLDEVHWLIHGFGFETCQEPNHEVVDCSACGSSGYAISGDLNLLEKLAMKTDARYIILVEKVISLSKFLINTF